MAGEGDGVSVREMTANELARLADCHSPDSPTSPGALLLLSVQDAALEDREGQEDREDLVSEIADAAPSICTHQMWLEFVDLCAYSENPAELGAEGADMDSQARTCLYLIAERLARRLLTDPDESEETEL